MKRIAGLLVVAMLTGCSPVLIKRGEHPPEEYHGIQSEMRRVEGNFAGSGDIYFSTGKGSNTAPFDAWWRGDSIIVCTFYDPFGRVAASVTVEPGGSIVETDGKRYHLPEDADIDLQGMFSGQDFTFRELIRILTGRLPTDDSISGKPDSLWREGKLIYAAWISDSWEIITGTRRRNGKLESIVYHTKLKPWSVVFRDFKTGIPHRIRIKTDRNDQFLINYKRIRPLKPKPAQSGA